MKRILGTWPYALGVVGLFALLWTYRFVAWSCEDPSGGCWGISPMDWKGTDIMIHLAAFPALAFLGAALLGFRRGYDGVSVLVCLALGMAIPEPQLAGFPWIDANAWINKDWFFLGLYAVVVHLGVAAGMLTRALVRRLSGGMPRERQRLSV
nr:hypothetical protein [Propionicimonas sp.]